jgi:hypothetical protein
MARRRALTTLATTSTIPEGVSRSRRTIGAAGVSTTMRRYRIAISAEHRLARIRRAV